jgi:ABC-2 type transport system permease protein
VSLGLSITLHARNIHHANILIQGGSLLATGLGGAIAPVSVLPGFLQHVAPLSPVYRALKGIRGISYLSWGFTEAAQPMLVLLGITVSALLFSVARYRHDEVKTFYV